MRYLLILLTLFSLACEPPQTFKDDDMGRKYSQIAPPPAHGVPLVAVITPRNGGWSGDNQLGYQAKYGPDRRGRQTILKLDEWGPPEIWTVSLSLIHKFGDFDGFRVTANIGFGAGGSTQEIKMDWANGAQISLPMNAINVVATFDDVEVDTEGQGLEMGVQLSRGPRGGQLPPIYTMIENSTVATPGNTAALRIPAFAKNIYAIPTEQSNAEITNFYSNLTRLSLFSGTGAGQFCTGSIDGVQLGQGLKLPVAASARFAFFINNTALPLNISVIAELDG